MKNVLTEAIAWLGEVDALSSDSWPEELPPEGDPKFWEIAMRLEMRDRQFISQRIEQLIVGSCSASEMTDLEAWLFGRRLEWACQLYVAAGQKGYSVDKSLADALRWGLLESWDSDGCLAFWNHAIERGGKPHPENVDGLSPLPS